MNVKHRFQTFPKKDRDEILRLNELQGGGAKGNSVLLQEGLTTYRRNVEGLTNRSVRSGYTYNTPHALFAGSINLFANQLIDRSILRRLAENNAKTQVDGFRLGARLRYVADLAMTADYSGGCDCLHVFDLLLACAINDTALLSAYIARHPGPAVKGHPFTVLACNAITALIMRNTCEYARLVDKLRARSEASYDMAMLHCAAGIMASSESEVVGALATILDLHKRGAASEGARRYFCIPAHGLFMLAKNVFQETVGIALSPPTVQMWDAEFHQLVLQQENGLVDFQQIETASKPIADWAQSLPETVGLAEFGKV